MFGNSFRQRHSAGPRRPLLSCRDLVALPNPQTVVKPEVKPKENVDPDPESNEDSNVEDIKTMVAYLRRTFPGVTLTLPRCYAPFVLEFQVETTVDASNIGKEEIPPVEEVSVSVGTEVAPEQPPEPRQPPSPTMQSSSKVRKLGDCESEDTSSDFVNAREPQRPMTSFSLVHLQKNEDEPVPAGLDTLHALQESSPPDMLESSPPDTLQALQESTPPVDSQTSTPIEMQPLRPEHRTFA